MFSAVKAKWSASKVLIYIWAKTLAQCDIQGVPKKMQKHFFTKQYNKRSNSNVPVPAFYTAVAIESSI
jgi:hypothetical protein